MDLVNLLSLFCDTSRGVNASISHFNYSYISKFHELNIQKRRFNFNYHHESCIFFPTISYYFNDIIFMRKIIYFLKLVSGCRRGNNKKTFTVCPLFNLLTQFKNCTKFHPSQMHFVQKNMKNCQMYQFGFQMQNCRYANIHILVHHSAVMRTSPEVGPSIWRSCFLPLIWLFKFITFFHQGTL